MKWRLVLALLVLAFLAALLLGRPAERAAPPPRAPGPSPADTAPTTTTTVTTTTVADCSGPQAALAQANGASALTLGWAPFRRPETGWLTYAPLIGREIGTTCPPDTPAFAVALTRWQARNGLDADGRFTPAAFERMRGMWNARRPIVGAVRRACPDPPRPEQLANARVTEGYRGKAVQMRPAVLEAYRRMVAAARDESPAIAADPQALTVFSAYRDPAADAARCLREGNCDGIRRARGCSPHRTGLALDLTVGAAPGYPVDSTADANRLAQSRTPAYRWLVANAARFGFVNYPFEPWHWEWTGEAP